VPFDVLLVDDSSRVSRDLADAIRFLQELKFNGVRVVYISQSIDSANEQAETLIAVHGVVDSLYIRELSKKTKRGLAGQLERGYATGSSTYGYRTVPEPDPSGKKDRHGHPAVRGHRTEIEPDEARVIVQIYSLFADGFGVRRIVEQLNRDRVPGPRGATRWKHGAVRRILGNERYTGKSIWGQRRHERQPGTRRRVARSVPREQWSIQERPDLRIVNPELWDRVQRRHAEVQTTLPGKSDTGRTLMRGRNAALHSPYLFSGFMRCAECGGSITVSHCGQGKSPRYGCSQSWRHGVSTCSNRLTVLAHVADSHLLEGLTSALLEPETIRYITNSVTAELNRRQSEGPKLETELRTAREQVLQRIQRLVHAIEQGAPPLTLTGAIRERETELQRLDEQLAELAEPADDDRIAVLPTLIRQQLQDLAGLLRGTPERTKSEFRRLSLSVTLHAVRNEGPAPFYRAEGRAALECLTGTRDFPPNRVAAVDRSRR
jgi:site-specific DNA recombinase